jgi:quercetin dioxygenase-like cupin family protein
VDIADIADITGIADMTDTTDTTDTGSGRKPFERGRTEGRDVELRHIPWTEPQPPGEPVLRKLLEAQGFEVTVWRDPADRVYDAHSHCEDERLQVLRGQIVLRAGDRDFPLGPGDCLDLPRGVVHTARAGPEGAVYLIGRLRGG